MLLSARRPARLQVAWLAFLASLVLLGGLVTLLAFDPASWFVPRTKARPLVVFCAAGLRKPVEEAAREYQDNYGVEVQLQYGGSDTLLGQIEVTGRADLYLPADDSYVTSGRDRNLLDESIPLASMRAVLAVKKGNPKQVKSLDDLLTRKLRVAHANPQAAAIGKLVREALSKSGHWPAFEKCVVVTKPTVTDVASDVALGAVDAGFVWDSTVKQVEGLEVVPLSRPEVTATMSACAVRSTEQPAEALRFARFLASRDRGAPLFAKHGFATLEGDRWEPTPVIHVYAGAMLRPAVEETFAEFEKREGVTIKTVYNGCGILVAQMKASKEAPDVYVACDTEFMNQVQELFGPPVVVSGNQLVILVRKGNPHRIRRLKDLAKPGLRVGIGHEKQCAMGVLTQQTMKEDRSTALVMKNVKVQSPTGDMLVNQMRTGSLDAAVAYVSNAAGAADVLEAIPIDVPCAHAEQPFATAKHSDCQQLCGRLLDAVLSRASKDRFTAYGFEWKAKKP
jgi:molybdenum ABC transporter molybdate-binding protein